MEPIYQTAIVGTSDGGMRLYKDVPIPEARGSRVIIRTKAVSVNPVDTKMIGAYVTAGAVGGCDFAGIVEKIAPDATSSSLRVGDRVCTAIMGMNPRDPNVGAFAEYTSAVEWILLKLPPSMSFEEGAALGISFMTTGLALFRSLGIPGYPLEPSTQQLPVFVFGGSSATGTAAIQLIKLAGFHPVVTCSPHNFDLVKSYGASAVFDYQDPECIQKIKKLTKNGLFYAMDCISTSDSMKFCYQVLGRAGGKYTSLEPYSDAVAMTRKVIKPDWVMGPQLMGEEIAWPEPHWRAADPEMAKFGAAWAVTLGNLLHKGLIRPHPLLIKQGGLSAVLRGIDDVRSKRISGKKLVYTL
ncbi:hypothetical protein HYFRA_00011528 [Hymenoscyphus fraxineus]|uniref:Enoyl reductase (ER) domain-containing protein n=1 Tax=Hymenoscyphus fraxineus TaxID=746836 RepID=A0A9N9PT26_9HELO|nr:hypothetical protein HYFRA_00011528 [Hymenoscyphus fraxineus]